MGLAWAVQAAPQPTMPTPLFRAFSPICRRQLCRRVTAWCLIAAQLALVVFQASPTAAAETSVHGEPPVKHVDPTSASPNTSVYLTGALGASNAGVAIRGVATVALGHWFIGFGIGRSEEILPSKSPGLMLMDFGPLLGLHSRNDYFAVAFGAGLSYVQTRTRGRFLESRDGWFANSYYEPIEQRSLGVPLMAHGMVHLGPVGLGGMVFGNINLNLPQIGAAGTLNVGWI